MGSVGLSAFMARRASRAMAALSPWQEVQRSPWALTSQPAGRFRGVPQPRSGAGQGESGHCLRTAPCCETPRER